MIKSFLAVTVMTFVCFGVAGMSSRFVDQEKLEKAVNQSVFNRGDIKYVQTEKNLNLEDAEKLEIDSTLEDISIEVDPTLKDVVLIKYNEVYDKETDELLYPEFETNNVNKSLSLSFKPAKKNYQKGQISINLNFPYFSIHESTKDKKMMKIFVPAKSNLSNLKIESMSGDLKFSKINLKSATIDTMSGDMIFDSLKIAELNIESKSGDVEFEDSSFSSINIRSTSGDIEFENIEVSDLIQLKSTSGDVEFEGKFKAGDFKTTAGDISIQTKSRKPDLKIAATAGDVDLHFLESPSIDIITSSMAGDVSLDGEEVETKNPMKVGAGEGRVKVATTAGDISITTKD